MNFISEPNFPKGRISLAAVSSQYPLIIEMLKQKGIHVIPVMPNKELPYQVQHHADMLCHPLGGKQIVAAKDSVDLINALDSFGFKVTPTIKGFKQTYPNDILLNAARIGNRLFGFKEHLDLSILNYCEENKITVISVKQGYTKCSIVPVDSNSIISEDGSIIKAAKACGMDVLQITYGNVLLPGYSHGFLGGSCGYIDNHLLAFTGDLKRHPDGLAIQDFLLQHKISYDCLTNGPLVDIGGIVPLQEYQPEKDKR